MVLYINMKSNEVLINKNGIVEFIVRGDQTPESVNKMADTADRLLKKQRAAGKPTIMLDDLTEMGKVPYAARKVVVQRAKDIKYQKLAFVINDSVIQLAANLIIRAIGKGTKVRHFASHDDAVKWLTAES